MFRRIFLRKQKALRNIKKHFKTVSPNDAFCDTVCGNLCFMVHNIWQDCFANGESASLITELGISSICVKQQHG